MIAANANELQPRHFEPRFSVSEINHDTRGEKSPTKLPKGASGFLAAS